MTLRLRLTGSRRTRLSTDSRTESPPSTRAGTALLVIDVQRELFGKSTPVCRAERLLAVIADLVARAHAAGAPVVYIQHSADRQLLYGSQGWQLHTGLQPAGGDLRIHKRHGNAFENTPLHAELTARGIAQVIATGLVTHGCVRATCLGAVALSYRTVLAEDGHSSYSKDAERLIEEWHATLRAAGIQVTPGRLITFD